MRSMNLNPIVNGVRPDPNFVNVIEVVGDAESRWHSLNIGASINFNVAPSAPSGPVMISGPGMVMIMNGAPPPPPPPGPAAAKNPQNARWNWRRMQMFLNYGAGRQLNDTDGPFSTPTTGNLRDDWGPARFQLRNLNANINFNASSASPYTILSGFDTNGDLIFNDRPAGVGRNSARGSPQ